MTPEPKALGPVTQWQHEYQRALAGLAAKAPLSEPKPRHWKTLSEICATDYGPTPWLIRGIMGSDALFCISGDPKASKTFALLEMAISVASQTNFLGHFSIQKHGACALFLNEDIEASVKTRAKALWAGRDLPGEYDTDLIRVISRADLDLGNPLHVAGLIADVCCMEPRPVLLGLDPLRNLHTAEENDSTEMATVMGTLRAIRDLCGCAVVFVHHSSKKGTGDTRSGGNRLRGSSTIYGAIDGLLSFEETENESARISNVSVTVTKHGRGAGTFRLALDIDDDKDGVATKATWTKSDVDEGEDKKRKEEEAPAKMADVVGRVMMYLKGIHQLAVKEGMEAVPTPIPAIVRDAMDICGTSRPTAYRAVTGLVEEGRLIERPISSKRSGLVLSDDEIMTLE